MEDISKHHIVKQLKYFLLIIKITLKIIILDIRTLYLNGSMIILLFLEDHTSKIKIYLSFYKCILYNLNLFINYLYFAKFSKESDKC